MERILFIHGYSAENKKAPHNAQNIGSIYGSLPAELRRIYGDATVLEINLSRYVSLDDGVTVDDISRGFDRALRTDFQYLLGERFSVVVHSTGALVIRNWLRKFSRAPHPVSNLVYLAGANFGSGWAHIGKGQVAKWGRSIFTPGDERGVRVLDALELGSDWTLDLHLHFLRPGSRMSADFGLREFVIVGTQADVSWFEYPVRYAKEDGSDGVVRVSASNVNFNYLRYGPTDAAHGLDWQAVKTQVKRNHARKGERDSWYEVKSSHHADEDAGPDRIPVAIPFRCAHSGSDMGVVTGERPRQQLLKLLQQALGTRDAAGWEASRQFFQAQTDETYRLAEELEAPEGFKKWISEPRAQYDPHAQVIFRLRDQDGRPVESFDIFFDSEATKGKSSVLISKLFEDTHANDVSRNVMTFYLRLARFEAEKRSWVPQLPLVNGAYLEISAVEPETPDAVYLPLRFEFTTDDLQKWIQPHRTTIIDVELLRLPSPDIFRMVQMP